PPFTRAAQAIALSFAILLAALSMANYWQIHQTQNMMSQMDQAVSKIYQSTFPGARPTRLVERALQTERQKLEGQIEAVQQLQSTPQLVDAIYCVIKSMPTDFSIKISEIGIDGKRLTLLGQVTNTKHLDTLKQKIEGYGFNAIQSEQRYGLEFSLSYQFPDSGIKTADTQTDELAGSIVSEGSR
ncbi:MAG: hypothetical protein AAGA30_15550, partial [Planctomycetota bacterium]